jgi:CubicO group peptidase (beta-lactamase class C family)
MKELKDRINRSDLLSKYLPNNITEDKDWASKVKLVDLATHTSGEEPITGWLYITY